MFSCCNLLRSSISPCERQSLKDHHHYHHRRRHLLRTMTESNSTPCTFSSETCLMATTSPLLRLSPLYTTPYAPLPSTLPSCCIFFTPARGKTRLEEGTEGGLLEAYVFSNRLRHSSSWCVPKQQEDAEMAPDDRPSCNHEGLKLGRRCSARRPAGLRCHCRGQGAPEEGACRSSLW